MVLVKGSEKIEKFFKKLRKIAKNCTKLALILNLCNWSIESMLNLKRLKIEPFLSLKSTLELTLF